MKLDLRKIYRFEPTPRLSDGALPSGGDIYYECTECAQVVSSVSHLKAQCDCGNLVAGEGACTIQAADKVNPLRGKLK